jgi:transcriptional regulator with XRE-family HTH domain
MAPKGSVPVPLSSAQLGSAIRRLRTERELTIEALASKAGIHWTYLTGVERGQRNPTLRVIAAIADALGIAVAELMRRAEASAERPGGCP